MLVDQWGLDALTDNAVVLCFIMLTVATWYGTERPMNTNGHVIRFKSALDTFWSDDCDKDKDKYERVSFQALVEPIEPSRIIYLSDNREQQQQYGNEQIGLTFLCRTSTWTRRWTLGWLSTRTTGPSWTCFCRSPWGCFHFWMRRVASPRPPIRPS